MKWRTERLGNFVTLKRGFDLPESRRVEGDVPIISSSGIFGFHSEKKVDGPGVVTGRYGTLGEVFYVEEPYWPLNTSLYVQDFHGNDPRFVFYLLKNQLKDIKSDKAAVPGVNRNDLHEQQAKVPDIVGQRRIAYILSAYDDLIENNRRRMTLLEESARQLYREWFVRLRFPGYEHTRIKNGVPEGWERKIFGDIGEQIRDIVSPEDLEPDTPYIGLEHMPRRSISLSTWGRAADVSSSKNRFRAGEILFGKIRPYFHKVGIAFVEGVASSDAIVIRPASEELRSLVLMTASSDGFVAQASQTMKEGSKMPRADWKVMEQYQVALPHPGLLNAFNSLIIPITEQLRTLTFQNQKLQTARDILLPRLMSGALAV